MKLRILAASLATVLGVAAVASAQSGIQLSATSHNFVSVPEGTTAKYGVRVTNNSGGAFPFQLSLTGSPVDIAADATPGSEETCASRSRS